MTESPEDEAKAAHVRRAAYWSTLVHAPAGVTYGIGRAATEVGNEEPITRATMIEVLQQHRVRSTFPVDVSFVVDNTDDKDFIEAAVRRAAARAS